MATKSRPQGVLHGMIPCYKPKGMVSKDVSRWFEKRFGKLKLGHVGTLDPMAEGVLPVLFGRATRLQDYLLEQAKTYEFEVTFGRATTTLDNDGDLVEERPYEHVTKERLAEICQELTGRFYQVPPLYSAIKYRGKPLYQYAREGRGDEVPLADLSKYVDLMHLDLLNYEAPRGRFRVTCSKGTYVRVIASKISECVETCGVVTGLVRSAAAGIGIDQCWTLEQLEELGEGVAEALIPVQRIELSIPKWRAYDTSLVDKLQMGKKMQVDMRYFEQGLACTGVQRAQVESVERMVLLDPEGNSFGIGSASIQNSGRITVVMKRGL